MTGGVELKFYPENPDQAKAKLRKLDRIKTLHKHYDNHMNGCRYQAK